MKPAPLTRDIFSRRAFATPWAPPVAAFLHVHLAIRRDSERTGFRPTGFYRHLEGLNNNIRVIQRRAYGIRDEEYLRLKILPAARRNRARPCLALAVVAPHTVACWRAVRS